MSKKILMCVCVLAMCVALAGCRGGREQDLPDPPQDPSTTTAPGEITVPTESETTAPIVMEPIYGTWAWDDDARFRLVFNEDSSGSRGLPNATRAFEWHSPEPGRLLIRINSATAWEDWDYTIIDGVLTITSRQADLTHSYTRA